MHRNVNVHQRCPVAMMPEESWSKDLQELQKDAIAIIAVRRSTETYFQRQDYTSQVTGQLRTACPCCIAVGSGLSTLR